MNDVETTSTESLNDGINFIVIDKNPCCYTVGQEETQECLDSLSKELQDDFNKIYHVDMFEDGFELKSTTKNYVPRVERTEHTVDVIKVRRFSGTLQQDGVASDT